MISLTRSFSVQVALAVIYFAQLTLAHAGITAPSTGSTGIIEAPNSIAPNAVGLAIFRRGPFGIIVFAAPLPIDTAAFRSQLGFSRANVALLPEATVVTVPLGPGQTLDVSPGTDSWIVTMKTADAVQQNAPPQLHAKSVMFPLGEARNSVMVPDPVTGEPLLIGTATGTKAARTRLRGIGYVTLPTWRGVAVRALSDELTLTQKQNGFSLQEAHLFGAPPLNKELASLDNLVPPLTKQELGLPCGSLVSLRHSLAKAQIALAVAPPLNALPASLHLAQVMLALGMGPEAEGVLKNALRDDPASNGNLLRERLMAVAGILKGEPSNFLELSSQDIGHSKEMMFWHAASLAEQGKAASAARLFSGSYRALLSYCLPLKEHLAPFVAETLIKGGQLSAAKIIIQALPGEKQLGLVRAELLEATHHQAAALDAYKNLKSSENVRIAGIATTHLILLRYSMKKLSAEKAAEKLGSQIYAWRGSNHELEVRLALARLRAKAGNWAEALRGLQHAIMLMPQSEARLQNERQQFFKKMFASGALAKLGPLEAVTAIEENEDLIPAGVAGAPILQVLAQRLLALDLPGVAAPVLKDLMSRTGADVSRVQLALALARVDLQSGNLRDAESALAQTDLPDLPPSIITKRRLILAEVKAKGGHRSSAIKLLERSGDSSTIALKLRLQLSVHDWKAAEATLEAGAAHLDSQPGVLKPEEAKLVMQLAMTALKAGDSHELAIIRMEYGSRMPPGKGAAIFNTVTAPPVDPHASLPKALKQIESIERVGRVRS